MTWDPQWGEEDAPVNPDDPEDICLPFSRTGDDKKVGGTTVAEPTYEENGVIYYNFDDMSHLQPFACSVCGVPIPTYHTAWSVYSWWPLGQMYEAAWACSETCAHEAQRRLRRKLRRGWLLHCLMWRECAEAADREHPGLESLERHEQIWKIYSPFRDALWKAQGYAPHE